MFLLVQTFLFLVLIDLTFTFFGNEKREWSSLDEELLLMTFPTIYRCEQ